MGDPVQRCVGHPPGVLLDRLPDFRPAWSPLLVVGECMPYPAILLAFHLSVVYAAYNLVKALSIAQSRRLFDQSCRARFKHLSQDTSSRGVVCILHPTGN